MTGGANLTPVVLLAYNRPDTTARVVERILDADPPELFVVADGPRNDPADRRRCAATRETILDAEWDCPVHTLFREENVGLPEAVYTGLDWVFEQVPEAIILEDDTVPSTDFFRYCGTLLDRYRETDRVMMINGTNRLGTWKADHQDYHFVTYQGVWGWATWRDAWDRYDPEMRAWEDTAVRDRIRETIDDDERFEYYEHRFQRSYDGASPAWSRMWRFALLANDGLAAVPSRNLVSNVGFDDRAVHTTDPDSPLADLPQGELRFPLDPPDALAPDREYERTGFEQFRRPSYATRLARRFTPRSVRTRVPTSIRNRLRSFVE
ncbi:glycosyltransferase family 2 protein [Halolamina sp.]|jgi:hypothetical protein|uniref:glycosyltransferase family 2 protein n=1 Tax=Halolamina sp. TaxID=1940283 RepID=UPI000223BD63|nr:methyltransferase FkbM [halophilic archaeon DL31]